MDSDQITENFVQDIPTPIAYEWAMDAKFKIAINLTWKDKILDTNGNMRTYGRNTPPWLHGGEVNPARAWMNTELTLDELAQHVQEGHAIAPQLRSFDGIYRDTYESFDDVWKLGGYRRESNFKAINWVAVDIDDGYDSIDQLAEQPFFDQFGSLLYTSASHSPEHPKARLVFALEQELTDPTEVRALYTALIRKFGGDEQCKDAARMFFGAEGCEVRKYPERYLPQNEMARLIRLGGIQLAEAGPYEGTGKTTAAIVRGKYLPPDTQFTLKNGSIISFSDVTKQYLPCFCPLPQHGTDKNPGAFLSKGDKGNYFVCKKCGDKAWWMEQEDASEGLLEKILAKKPKKKSYKQRMIEKYQQEQDQSDDPLQRCYSPEDLLEFGNEYEPYPKEKRAEMLRKHYRASEKKMLLYAAEGFGKSYLAYLLITEHKRQVVFCCKSNAQAEEQYESFSKLGINAQLICAREHWLRTIEKVDVEVYDPKHPWDYQELNETRTKQNMKRMGMSDEKIEALWQRYADPKPDFDQYDMIITTQARVSGWGRIQMTHQIPVKSNGRMVGMAVKDDMRIVPRKAVIFCDDAQLEDFCMLSDFNNDFVKTKYYEFLQVEGEQDPVIDGKPIQRKEIDDCIYFVRPKSLLFGYGFEDNQIVFSTTEQVTREMIFRRYGGRKVKGEGRVYEPELIPEHDQKMNAGTITVMKTQFVRKRLDGILPVIAERVRAIWNNKVGYVADGQGCETNHVTIKGQNAFSDHDMIIEISYDHMGKIRKLLHELEWGNDDAEFLKVMLACDTIHQAVGRNSGYRFSDRPREERREAVVLVEPRLFQNVLKYLRYKVTAAVDLDHANTRLKRDHVGKHFATTIGWFIRHPIAYMKIQGGRTFIGDVKRSLKNVGAKSTHPLVRQRRLLESLKTIKEDVARRDEISCVDNVIGQIEAIDTVNSSVTGSPEAATQ